MCGQASRQSKIDFGILNLHVYTTRRGNTFLSGAFVSVLLVCPSNKQFLLVLGLRVWGLGSVLRPRRVLQQKALRTQGPPGSATLGFFLKVSSASSGTHVGFESFYRSTLQHVKPETYELGGLPSPEMSRLSR